MSKFKHYKKKEKSLNSLEIRNKKLKELGEAENYVKQVENLNSEESRKFVVDQVKEEELDVQKVQDDLKTELEKKVKHHFSYRRELSDYGNWLVEEIKEKGWEIEFVPTDGRPINIYGKSFKTQEGIQLIIKSPVGQVFARGVQISYVPAYDEHAIRTLYVQAENTMDSYKGLLLSDKKKPNGIIL